MNIEISFYTATILFAYVCGILATFIGYIHKDKFKELKFFYVYPLASFTQMSLFFILFFLRIEWNVLIPINWTGQCIFLLIEFLTINHFFSEVLNSHRIKRILKASRPLYFVILLFYWIWVNYFFSPSVAIFVFQAGFILVPTFVYFLEMFKTPVTFNLYSDFSFWISAGILFYFSCTLPIFLLVHYMFDKNEVFRESTLSSINYICYGILFLSITKAYLCPRRDTP